MKGTRLHFEAIKAIIIINPLTHTDPTHPLTFLPQVMSDVALNREGQRTAEREEERPGAGGGGGGGERERER